MNSERVDRGVDLKLKQASVVLDVVPKAVQNLVQFKVVRPTRRGRVYWFDRDTLLQTKCALHLKETLGASTTYLRAFVRALAVSPAPTVSRATIRFESRPGRGQPSVAVIVPVGLLRREIEARLPLVAVARDLPPGRRRPGWQQAFLQTLHEAARDLPPVSDARIASVVRAHRRSRRRPEIAVVVKA